MRLEALIAAAHKRAHFAIPDATSIVRLVDDAGDVGCDDVVVDRFGAVVRIEFMRAAWPDDAVHAAAALANVTGAASVVGLLRPPAGQGKAQLRVLHGDAPHGHVAHEAGMRLFLRATDPDAPGVGVFVDQREGRAWVKRHAHGKRVLNLFAHAGAFGAAAVAGGAARVDHVDAAKKCAPWAALQLALGGENPRAHRFLVEDALVVLRRAAKRAPAYDIVVCDPPTTAIRPDGSRFRVEHDLPIMADECIRALDERGRLLLSTNHRDIRAADVADVVRVAARKLGRSVTLRELPLPPDITTASHPVLRPVRGVLAHFDGAVDVDGGAST